MNKFTHITNVIIFSKQSFGELTPIEIRISEEGRIIKQTLSILTKEYNQVINFYSLPTPSL